MALRRSQPCRRLKLKLADPRSIRQYISVILHLSGYGTVLYRPQQASALKTTGKRITQEALNIETETLDFLKFPIGSLNCKGKIWAFNAMLNSCRMTLGLPSGLQYPSEFSKRPSDSAWKSTTTFPATLVNQPLMSCYFFQTALLSQSPDSILYLFQIRFTK